jgi:hypothetical protein
MANETTHAAEFLFYLLGRRTFSAEFPTGRIFFRRNFGVNIFFGDGSQIRPTSIFLFASEA